MRQASLLAAVLFASAFPAGAAYIMTPLSGGSGSLAVLPGEQFNLDIVLTSDAADEHLSAIFRVVFSSPGLLYRSYDWQSPYATGTQDDDSTPLIGELPVLLDADTLAGPGYPPNAIDVELSNVVPDPSAAFGTGTLVTLTLEVPSGYAAPETVTISVQPDQIYFGFTEIQTTAGPSFELTVVPEPAISCLLGLGALAAILARRG